MLTKTAHFLILGLLLMGNLWVAAQPGLYVTKRTAPVLLQEPRPQPLASMQGLSLTVPRTSNNNPLPQLRAFFRPKPAHSSVLQTPASDLAFFCRLELRLEDATRMPVRFRLGSSQYVDYLEGKFEGWRYGY